MDDVWLEGGDTEEGADERVTVMIGTTGACDATSSHEHIESMMSSHYDA